MTPIARIAIRTDGHLILGKAFTADLKPGHVYELRRAVMTDDIVLHDLGLSALTAEASDSEAIAVTAWCSLPQFIIEDGVHLWTREEARRPA